MATQVQFRRGTTSQNNAFTGAAGELTVDTQVWTIRIHDGTTAGGRTVPTLTATQTFTNKTLGSGSVWNGASIGLGYGGTGAALTGVAGAIVYSQGSAFGLSLAGTSGQVLTSGGTSGPTWVNASALSTGTATTATTATNISGGSAGYIMYQIDTNETGFIAPGTSGYVLRSTGASSAPGWVSSTVTLGSTATQVGDTSNAIAGLVSLTMGNGSYGGGTVASVSGTGPWTATITGISSTAGILVGQNITATAGTGSLFGGSPTSVLVASVASATSITVTVTGGTIPTTGTITSITIFGFLQVPTGTSAQRPYSPAAGMIRYNSTLSSFEGYGSAWASLGGVKSVDGYTYILAETSAGAGNGDLDFYAENSGGNGATQIGQWNRTNLKDYTGTIVGTQTTQNVFNATATTVNAFGAGTTIGVGATTGTLTLNNPTVVGSQTTVNLWNTTSTTVNAFGASTALTLGATTGTTSIRNATLSLPNATAITTGQTTVALLNTTATTVNAFGAATTLNFGSSSTGATTTFAKNVTIVGNLTVQGTTTTEASSALTVSDSAVYLNDGATGDTKDIGLIGTYLSTTTKYTGFVRDATDGVWKLFSAPTNAPAAGSIVDFTGATYDSVKLTAVNKVTITEPASAVTLTLASGSTFQTAGSVSHAGAYSQTFTATANTSVTLPTTGTLATLAGSETLTNKTISAGTLTGTLTASSSAGTNGQFLQTTGTGVQWATVTMPGSSTDQQLNSLGVGTAGSATTGQIRATNSITSYYSDDQLKTRTGNIENALDKVLSLDGFHYHANETAVALGYDSSIEEVGLSAQQVQKILPQIVVPAPIDDKYLTIHYERMIPLLVEAIKEQQKQIEELKAKLGN